MSNLKASRTASLRSVWSVATCGPWPWIERERARQTSVPLQLAVQTPLFQGSGCVTECLVRIGVSLVSDRTCPKHEAHGHLWERRPEGGPASRCRSCLSSALCGGALSLCEEQRGPTVSTWSPGLHGLRVLCRVGSHPEKPSGVAGVCSDQRGAFREMLCFGDLVTCHSVSLVPTVTHHAHR